MNSISDSFRDAAKKLGKHKL